MVFADSAAYHGQLPRDRFSRFELRFDEVDAQSSATTPL